LQRFDLREGTGKLAWLDSFVKQGFPPIKIVRRALLGNDSPTL